MWKDSDRNYWMTAEEAREYGMIDSVLVRKKDETPTEPQAGNGGEAQ